MDVNAAQDALRYADVARRRARRDVGIAWFPLVLFGTLILASLAVPSGASLAYWLLAGPLGSLIVGMYSYRQVRSRGVQAQTGPLYALVVAVLLIAPIAAYWFLKGLGVAWLAPYGALLIVAGGYIAFAALERNRVVGLVAGALLAVTIMVAAAGIPTSAAGPGLTLLFGVAFVVTGLALRLGRRTSA